MEIVWNKKNYESTLTREKNGVVWLEFKRFCEKGFPLLHAYSTRLGGVSSGVVGSMNLRNCEYDSRENYEKNMHLFFDAVGFTFDNIVASHQTHTNNVHVVRRGDVPTGTLFGREFQDIDGLVTNLRHVPLVCSFADCIPLYFYAGDVNAIGISHGGWRGCVSDIAGETVRALVREYGADVKNIYAGIGPGICQDCYEVSTDVYEKFAEELGKEELGRVFRDGREGHFQLDLWEANRIFMLRAGIPEGNITVTDICTRCNSDKLFSHRVKGFKRGNQIGVMELI
ncbi:MAG: polyphenol oxidase family protein [Lachnospiraceae bacterium]|nr:polyphenol oxidase family protein [Lachnospiraceae bacterium]